jgi:Domain of unknown function (DUF5122) beta-propeller/Secretion system C-terminal sorting domain
MNNRPIVLVALFVSNLVMAQVPLGLDTTFRQTLIEEEGISAIYPLEDGRVWISGYWTYPPFWQPQLWGRLLEDGSMDLSTPQTSYPGVGQLERFGDHYYIDTPVRFSLDGVLDADFPYPPPPPWNTPNGLGFGAGGFLIQPDGKRVATGESLWFTPFGVNEANVHYATHRYLSEVQYLDSTFHNGAANGSGEKIFGLPDGRMLVSGRFTQFNGQPTGSLVRIWPDGQLDTTFQSPITGALGGYPECYFAQPDGRVVLGGAFMVAGVPDTLGLIRLHTDGSLDTGFHYSTRFKDTDEPQYIIQQSTVRAIEQLEDGRFLVGGNFTEIDGYLRRNIALFDSTGHLITTAFNGQGCGLVHPHDTTFAPYSEVYSIDKAPDGSIFLSGAFHGFDDGITNDTNQRMICKLYGLHVGVQERVKVPSLLRVYPNPGSDEVHVSWSSQDIIHVQLSDALGRVVSTSLNGGGNVWLDTRCLVPGCYVVEVRARNGSRTTHNWIKQ